MKSHLTAFLLALATLSVIPVRFSNDKNIDWQYSRRISSQYYALVGFILAAIIFSVYLALSSLNTPFLTSAIILCTWVGLTGALHLDGLADSVDALAATHSAPQNKERTLAIFKDPLSGPMAIVATVLLLLLKFASLHTIINTHSYAALLLFPILVVPRLLCTWYLNHTAYARESGMASGLNKRYSSIFSVFIFMLLHVALAYFTLHISNGYTFLSAALLASLIAFCTVQLWRKIWLKRIKGYTGDTLGAAIELSECTMMLFLAIYLQACL